MSLLGTLACIGLATRVWGVCLPLWAGNEASSTGCGWWYLPTLPIPTSSTSHFVNSQFVNSQFVNSQFVNIDQMGIDKVGIDKLGSWLNGNWQSGNWRSGNKPGWWTRYMLLTKIQEDYFSGCVRFACACMWAFEAQCMTLKKSAMGRVTAWPATLWSYPPWMSQWRSWALWAELWLKNQACLPTPSESHDFNASFIPS